MVRTWVGLQVLVDEALQAEAAVHGEELHAGVERVALDVVGYLLLWILWGKMGV